MKTTPNPVITVETRIYTPVGKVWKLWINPKHIIRWNQASDDWHTLRAENDLHPGGRFKYRMEAKDGSMGFDLDGEYSKVDTFRQIDYTLSDGRKVQVFFSQEGDETRLTEIFEAENTNSLELQQAGWQSILNNFKRYAESSGKFEIMHFAISISASPEKVYQTLIDKDGYQEWTSEFNSTSHFKGSWEKNSKILFLGTDAEGNQGGMVSRIKENIPGRFISIEHLGIIRNGEEILSGAEVEGWAGSLENYTISQVDKNTLFEVTIDSNPDFKSYFSETWPRALQKLKEICER